MKKRFYEPIFFYIECAVFFPAIFYGLGILAPKELVELAEADGTPIFYAYALCGALTLAFIWLFVKLVWPRLDWFVVTDTYAEWHGFLRRKRRLYYDDCRYMDVETFNKEAQRPIIRGDECAMIYLSMDPFPEKLRGRINHLRCTNRIIRFPYSDKLALALIEAAPKEKTHMIQSFYGRMQFADRQLKRAKENYKKRKKRKK